MMPATRLSPKLPTVQVHKECLVAFMNPHDVDVAGLPHICNRCRVHFARASPRYHALFDAEDTVNDFSNTGVR